MPAWPALPPSHCPAGPHSDALPYRPTAALSARTASRPCGPALRMPHCLQAHAASLPCRPTLPHCHAGPHSGCLAAAGPHYLITMLACRARQACRDFRARMQQEGVFGPEFQVQIGLVPR